MVYAAGFGKRLLPLTAETPKPLIRVKQRPILDWVIAYISHYGVSEIIINTHYLHDQIVSFLQSKNYPCRIQISHESQILGTAGGLYNTREFWDKEDFLVCNGDTLSNADLKLFINHHSQSNSLVSLAVTDRVSGSMLLIDEAGKLVGIQKGGRQQILAVSQGRQRPVHFCGYHLISPRIFSLLNPPLEFSIIDQYLIFIKKGIPISTWNIGDAYWESIETAEILEKVNREFPCFSFELPS